MIQFQGKNPEAAFRKAWSVDRKPTLLRDRRAAKPEYKVCPVCEDSACQVKSMKCGRG